MKKTKTMAEPLTMPLGIGTVRIYSCDGVRLHAYATNNPFADESFLFETQSELIGLESPLFKDNLAEYLKYIKSLDKPLNHFIIAYHPGGGHVFTNCRFYATENAQRSMLESGSIKAIIDNFVALFGDKLDASIPAVTDIIKPGKVTIGGLKFIVQSTAESFDLEIPALNAVYTHMVGAKTHNMLESAEQIDAMIAQMKDYAAKNYSLILTTHDVPAPIEITAEKIAYLKHVKKAASVSRSGASFITAVKAAFPNYAGVNYLEMSAKALFKGK
jgi:hypothetical protein